MEPSTPGAGLTAATPDAAVTTRLGRASIAIRTRLPHPAPVAAFIVAVVAVLTVLGSLVIDGRLTGTAGDLFDLDREGTAPALFSWLVLMGAALCALAAWRPGHRELLAISAFFAFMAFDELLTVHEHAEELAGVDWQLLYVPIVAVAAVAWLATLLRDLTTPPLRTLWVLGAVAWVAAQVFEKLQWDPDLVHPWMIAPEEALETLGAGVWLLALLIAARALAPAER